MQSLATIRTWHLQQLQFAIPTYQRVFATIDEQTARTLRDGDEGWTILQVMGHLRDFEALFIERATLTLAENNPPLPFPDPDTLAASKNDNELPLMQPFEAWAALRQQYVELLSAIEDENAWERPAQHPMRGNFTLHDQLFLTAWHDMNHLKQICTMLGA